MSRLLGVRMYILFPLWAAPYPAGNRNWNAWSGRRCSAGRACSDFGGLPRGPSGPQICREAEPGERAAGVRGDAIERVRGPRSARTAE